MHDSMPELAYARAKEYELDALAHSGFQIVDIPNDVRRAFYDQASSWREGEIREDRNRLQGESRGTRVRESVARAGRAYLSAARQQQPEVDRRADELLAAAGFRLRNPNFAINDPQADEILESADVTRDALIIVLSNQEELVNRLREGLDFDAAASQALARRLATGIGVNLFEPELDEGRRAETYAFTGEVADRFRGIIAPAVDEILATGEVSQEERVTMHNQLREFFYSQEFARWKADRRLPFDSLTHVTDAVDAAHRLVRLADQQVTTGGNVEVIARALLADIDLEVNYGEVQSGSPGDNMPESLVERSIAPGVDRGGALRAYEAILRGDEIALPSIYNVASRRARGFDRFFEGTVRVATIGGRAGAAEGIDLARRKRQITTELHEEDVASGVGFYPDQTSLPIRTRERMQSLEMPKADTDDVILRLQESIDNIRSMQERIIPEGDLRMESLRTIVPALGILMDVNARDVLERNLGIHLYRTNSDTPMQEQRTIINGLEQTLRAAIASNRIPTQAFQYALEDLWFDIPSDELPSVNEIIRGLSEMRQDNLLTGMLYREGTANPEDLDINATIDDRNGVAQVTAAAIAEEESNRSRDAAGRLRIPQLRPDESIEAVRRERRRGARRDAVRSVLPLVDYSAPLMRGTESPVARAVNLSVREALMERWIRPTVPVTPRTRTDEGADGTEPGQPAEGRGGRRWRRRGGQEPAVASGGRRPPGGNDGDNGVPGAEESGESEEQGGRRRRRRRRDEEFEPPQRRRRNRNQAEDEEESLPRRRRRQETGVNVNAEVPVGSNSPDAVAPYLRFRERQGRARRVRQADDRVGMNLRDYPRSPVVPGDLPGRRYGPVSVPIEPEADVNDRLRELADRLGGLPGGAPVPEPTRRSRSPLPPPGDRGERQPPLGNDPDLNFGDPEQRRQREGGEPEPIDIPRDEEELSDDDINGMINRVRQREADEEVSEREREIVRAILERFPNPDQRQTREDYIELFASESERRLLGSTYQTVRVENEIQVIIRPSFGELQQMDLIAFLADLQPRVGDISILEGDASLETLFSNIHGRVNPNIDYFVSDPLREIPDDELENFIADPQLVFLISDGNGGWYANPDVAPYAYDDREIPPIDTVDPRFRTAEMATEGDSGLFGLAASRAGTPAEQQALYLALAKTILKIHRADIESGNPTLLHEWLTEQGTDPEDRVSSLRIFIENDHQEDAQGNPDLTAQRAQDEVLLSYLINGQDGSSTYDEQGTAYGYWNQRIENLDSLVNESNPQFTFAKLRQIEFLSHMVDVPSLIQAMGGREPAVPELSRLGRARERWREYQAGAQRRWDRRSSEPSVIEFEPWRKRDEQPRDISEREYQAPPRSIIRDVGHTDYRPEAVAPADIRVEPLVRFRERRRQSNALLGVFENASGTGNVPAHEEQIINRLARGRNVEQDLQREFFDNPDYNDTQAAVVFVRNNNIYTAVRGNMRVVLNREGQAIELTRGSNTVSRTEHQPNDSNIIIANSRFWELMPDAQEAVRIIGEPGINTLQQAREALINTARAEATRRGEDTNELTVLVSDFKEMQIPASPQPVPPSSPEQAGGPVDVQLEDEQLEEPRRRRRWPRRDRAQPSADSAGDPEGEVEPDRLRRRIIHLPTRQPAESAEERGVVVSREYPINIDSILQSVGYSQNLVARSYIQSDQFLLNVGRPDETSALLLGVSEGIRDDIRNVPFVVNNLQLALERSPDDPIPVITDTLINGPLYGEEGTAFVFERGERVFAVNRGSNDQNVPSVVIDRETDSGHSAVEYRDRDQILEIPNMDEINRVFIGNARFWQYVFPQQAMMIANRLASEGETSPERIARRLIQEAIDAGGDETHMTLVVVNSKKEGETVTTETGGGQINRLDINLELSDGTVIPPGGEIPSWALPGTDREREQTRPYPQPFAPVPLGILSLEGMALQQTPDIQNDVITTPENTRLETIHYRRLREGRRGLGHYQNIPFVQFDPDNGETIVFGIYGTRLGGNPETGILPTIQRFRELDQATDQTIGQIIREVNPVTPDTRREREIQMAVVRGNRLYGVNTDYQDIILVGTDGIARPLQGESLTVEGASLDGVRQIIIGSGALISRIDNLQAAVEGIRNLPPDEASQRLIELAQSNDGRGIEMSVVIAQVREQEATGLLSADGRIQGVAESVPASEITDESSPQQVVANILPNITGFQILSTSDHPGLRLTREQDLSVRVQTGRISDQPEVIGMEGREHLRIRPIEKHVLGVFRMRISQGDGDNIVYIQSDTQRNIIYVISKRGDSYRADSQFALEFQESDAQSEFLHLLQRDPHGALEAVSRQMIPEDDRTRGGVDLETLRFLTDITGVATASTADNNTRVFGRNTQGRMQELVSSDVIGGIRNWESAEQRMRYLVNNVTEASWNRFQDDGFFARRGNANEPFGIERDNRASEHSLANRDNLVRLFDIADISRESILLCSIYEDEAAGTVILQAGNQSLGRGDANTFSLTFTNRESADDFLSWLRFYPNESLNQLFRHILTNDGTIRGTALFDGKRDDNMSTKDPFPNYERILMQQIDSNGGRIGEPIRLRPLNTNSNFRIPDSLDQPVESPEPGAGLSEPEREYEAGSPMSHAPEPYGSLEIDWDVDEDSEEVIVPQESGLFGVGFVRNRGSIRRDTNGTQTYVNTPLVLFSENEHTPILMAVYERRGKGERIPALNGTVRQFKQLETATDENIGELLRVGCTGLLDRVSSVNASVAVVRNGRLYAVNKDGANIILVDRSGQVEQLPEERLQLQERTLDDIGIVIIGNPAFLENIGDLQEAIQSIRERNITDPVEAGEALIRLAIANGGDENDMSVVIANVTASLIGQGSSTSQAAVAPETVSKAEQIVAGDGEPGPEPQGSPETAERLITGGIEYQAATEVGTVREKNQDAYFTPEGMYLPFRHPLGLVSASLDRNLTVSEQQSQAEGIAQYLQELGLTELEGIRYDAARIVGIQAKVKELIANEELKGLAIVADGMGGHASGEIASTLATIFVADHILQKQGSKIPTEQLLQDAILHADRLIWDVGEAEFRKLSEAIEDPERKSERAELMRQSAAFRSMGTTIAITMTDVNDGTFGASVGDTRTYKRNRTDNTATLLTRDQSVVMGSIVDGHVTPSETFDNTNRNLLISVVGHGELGRTSINSFTTSLADDEELVLATDGVWEGVNKQDPRIIRELEAIDRKFNDNITIHKMSREQAALIAFGEIFIACNVDVLRDGEIVPPSAGEEADLAQHLVRSDIQRYSGDNTTALRYALRKQEETQIPDKERFPDQTGYIPAEPGEDPLHYALRIRGSREMLIGEEEVVHAIVNEYIGRDEFVRNEYIRLFTQQIRANTENLPERLEIEQRASGPAVVVEYPMGHRIVALDDFVIELQPVSEHTNLTEMLSDVICVPNPNREPFVQDLPEEYSSVFNPEQYVFQPQLEYFKSIRSSGGRQWILNPDVFPYMYSETRSDRYVVRVDARFRMAIQAFGTRPLLALAAASAPDPEIQQRLYATMARTIVGIHRQGFENEDSGNPALFREWLKAQGNADDGNSSLTSLIEYDHLNANDSSPAGLEPVEAKRMLGYTGDSYNENSTVIIWMNRVQDLQRVLSGTPPELSEEQLMYIEVLAGSIDVGRLLGDIAAAPRGGNIYLTVPVVVLPMEECRNQGVLLQSPKKLIEPGKKGIGNAKIMKFLQPRKV